MKCLKRIIVEDHVFAIPETMSAEDFSNQLQVSDSLTSHPAVVKLDSSLPS